MTTHQAHGLKIIGVGLVLITFELISANTFNKNISLFLYIMAAIKAFLIGIVTYTLLFN